MLIAKLFSYDSSFTSLRLLSDCLSNRKQRIKVKTAFSKWENIETGVPTLQVMQMITSPTLSTNIQTL